MTLPRVATSPPVEPSPIHGVQPGGGYLVALEHVWGRLRRWWLRQTRPDYVEQMLRLRHGECPGCPHDIIDSRDLKLCRNLCGYWFAPEDDAFAWRSKLGLARYGLTEVIVFSLALLALAGLCFALGATVSMVFYPAGALAIVLWIFILSFFRDPEREIPSAPGLLVCPADGKVTHVETVDDPEFPASRMLRVSIFLSVFNVHVNRSATAGEVTEVRYFPGAYLDARKEESAVRNEQLWVDLVTSDGGVPVRIKQIAGAIARRIVCTLRVGQKVAAGEKYGMIKFGSRTDVLVPADAVREVLVKVGDKVRGGADRLLLLSTSAGSVS